MKKSFTLIELLIVIGIMAIFTALTLSIMVSIRNQRQVKIVAEQVKSRIMEAHSLSVTPSEAVPVGATAIRLQLKSTVSPRTLDILYITSTGSAVSLTSIPPLDKLPSTIFFTSTAASTIKIDPQINFSASGTNIGQITTATPFVSGGNVTFYIQSTNGKNNKMTVNQLTGSVTIN